MTRNQLKSTDITRNYGDVDPYPCPSAPLQEVHLEVVPIAGQNQEVNLTAVVLPREANMTVFYWWIGDSLQVSFSYFSCQGQFR